MYYVQITDTICLREGKHIIWREKSKIFFFDDLSFLVNDSDDTGISYREVCRTATLLGDVFVVVCNRMICCLGPQSCKWRYLTTNGGMEVIKSIFNNLQFMSLNPQNVSLETKV